MFFLGIFLIVSVWTTLQFGKHVSTNSILEILVFLLVYVLMHALYILVFWLLSLPCDKTKPIQKQRRYSRTCVQGTCSFICSYLGVRVIMRGAKKVPTKERFVLISNHRSAVDPIIMIDKMRQLNLSFIAKPSVIALPFLGTIMYQAGCLPIDRENDRAALKTIQAAAGYVKQGICSMGIFPEGTRNTADELLPFHPGSFKLAQRANAPLVIACIRGTEDAKKFITDRRKTAYLDFLEVLPAEQVKKMSTQQLSEYCRLRIQLALYTPEDEDPTIEIESVDDDENYEDDCDYEDEADEAAPETAGDPEAKA